MQARPAAVGEGEIVTLPLRCIHTAQSFGSAPSVSVVFGEAEAELGIEIVGGLHVGREAVDVVDALDARALIGRIFLQHRGHAIHLEIEIERHADRIGGAQRAALERHVRPRHRQVARVEPFGGLVEIVFAADLEAERERRDVVRLAQHDRVMVALLDAAQIERVAVLVGDEIAEAIDIEGARAGEVGHAEFDMARAHDIERRIEDGIAEGMGSASQALSCVIPEVAPKGGEGSFAREKTAGTRLSLRSPG